MLSHKDKSNNKSKTLNALAAEHDPQTKRETGERECGKEVTGEGLVRVAAAWLLLPSP